ncbi:MAG: serine/threonine protein kinase [Deltaproteobacteria bacterium]|nr:serine/threonine protein kinase [Deltaproteobacteria bacterium]
MTHEKTPLLAGRYELNKLAGEGGMATVWRSVMHGAAGFSRLVAVKRILPHLISNKEFIAMFVEEARVGSLLQHPNIVQILDFNVDERGFYFLVMEWVEGVDLGGYLKSYATRELPTEWPLIAAIGIEALRGLGAAHERLNDDGQLSPVIHRDVTPQNILVGSNGVVKLTDFGLSRAMDRSRMTQPDIIKGKLAYIAPEISRGETASPASDIFSLSVVLWEALAGRRLYQGATDVEVFLAAREAKIPPLGEFRSDLPVLLLDAIGRGLSVDPAGRYGSALAMARALADVLRREPKKTDAPVLAQSVLSARVVLEAAKTATAEHPAVGAADHSTTTVSDEVAVPLPPSPRKPTPSPPPFTRGARPAPPPPPIPAGSLQFDIDVVEPLEEVSDSISLQIDLDELLRGQSSHEIQALSEADLEPVPLTSKKKH